MKAAFQLQKNVLKRSLYLKEETVRVSLFSFKNVVHLCNENFFQVPNVHDSIPAMQERKVLFPDMSTESGKIYKAIGVENISWLLSLKREAYCLGCILTLVSFVHLG
jgi:hypothetical protein